MAEHQNQPKGIDFQMLNILEIETTYKFQSVIQYIKAMNPIKNKKDLEATVDEIRNYAYSYLEKYNPSKQQLRTYLFKRFIKINQKINIFGKSF